MSKFARCERGATAIEYALIAGLISILIIGAVSAIGTQVKALLQSIAI